MNAQNSSPELAEKVTASREGLDAHVRETIEWHFNPDTGCPFWLDYAGKLVWDPCKEIVAFVDLKKFPLFEDDWLRGGPVRRWLPKAYEKEPALKVQTRQFGCFLDQKLSAQKFRLIPALQ